MKLCSIEGCEKPHRAKSYCKSHYDKFTKYGDPIYEVESKSGRINKKHSPKRKPKFPYEENHKMISGIEHKLCRICESWIPMDDDHFYVKKTRDGYDSYCKDCSRKKYKKYRDEHADIYIERTYKHYQENKEVYDERRTKWMKDNEEFVKEYRKEWLKLNSEHMSEYYANRSANKKHEIDDEEWKSCLKFFDNSCAYCGIPQDTHKEITNQVLHKEHFDHEGANDLSNAIPACRRCNSSKWAHDVDNWYPQQKYYDKNKLIKIRLWINEVHKKYLKVKN